MHDSVSQNGMQEGELYEFLETTVLTKVDPVYFFRIPEMPDAS